MLNYNSAVYRKDKADMQGETTIKADIGRDYLDKDDGAGFIAADHMRPISAAVVSPFRLCTGQLRNISQEIYLAFF